MIRQSLLRIILLLLFQYAGVCYAQWRGPILTPLGPAEGLPNLVNKVISDANGYKYFATNTGLYRYDGHRFTFYAHDPRNEQSIGPGEILNMIYTSDGLIWMALRFGGINSYDPGTGIFKRYPLPEMAFRSIPSAHGLYEDPDGTLWVGGLHFRLFAFDRASGKFTQYAPDWIDPEKHGGRLSVLSITPDPYHADSLWISVLGYATENSMFNSYGLVVFRKSTKEFIPTPYAGYIRHVDSSGVMWGTCWGNFITRFDPATMAFDTFQHQFYLNGQSLTPLSRGLTFYQGKIIVASSLAVMEFDTGHFNTILTQQHTGENYSLYADPENNLWIGTSLGVQVLNPADQHIRFFSLDQFEMYKRIFPGRLAHDDHKDVIYLSHTQYPHPPGYYTIPLNTKESTKAAFHPTSFPVQGLAMDIHDKLWAVGAGALYQLDPELKKESRIIFNDPLGKPIPGMMSMVSSPSGWIGMFGSGEFLWFHPDTQRLKRIRIDQLPGSAYAKSFDNGFDGFSFGSDHKAYLFSNEVHLLDLISGKATVLHYDPAINPHHQRILFMGEDSSGYIWLSSFVHTGKYKIEGDSLILVKAYGIQEGLISSGATEMAFDAYGRVWVYTQNGLNAIDPETNEIRFFGTREGLPIPFLDPRQVLSITGGRMATVCHNGLIVYQAEELWNSASPYQEVVVIKRIRIDGKEIATDVSVNHLSRIELKPGNTSVDIEVQALSFPTDYKMEYSYRIAALQNEWISIGQNQLITLPSLAPGEYKFEVKAGNPQSQAPIKSIAITVLKPLYRKSWFILLSLGSLLALLLLYMRWRISRIREHEAERTEINKQMAELELKALRSQMNPHFMFNSLNSIKNYILHAEPKLAAEYLSNFAHLIRMILQHSREKAITLQEELETLVLYVELEQIRFENKFQFNCVVEKNVPLEQIMIPPMILQPFIENAIWHGLMHKKAEGHLTLTFTAQDKNIACIIDDDGVGRKKAAELKSLSSTRYKSMGMGITRDRIELMNKMDALGIRIDVVDKIDSSGNAVGTRVTVLIPGVTEI